MKNLDYISMISLISLTELFENAGKTTTLCKRAQKMIESGISPANILIVTFTNKAANDMREKLEKVLSGSNCDIK